MPPLTLQQAARQLGAFRGSPGLALLQGPRAASRASAPDPLSNLSPGEEQSLLRQAGSVAVGGITAAGAALDIESGAIRNLLVGKAPRPHLLSFEGQATGRDVLENFGLVGRNRPGFIAPGGNWYNPADWDWGDLAGFATEVALDPKTYFSFGGAAVGRAGKALKNAGLWDFLPASAAKAGIKGRMATRQQMTIGKTLEGMAEELQPAALERVARQARQMKVPLADIMDEPLGGATRFWPTGAVVGKAGGLGGKVATALDPIGEAIRYGKYSPVRPAYAALSKPLRGYMDPDMQRSLFNAQVDVDFRIQHVRQEGIRELSRLKDASMLTPEQIKLHRKAVEWKPAQELTDNPAELMALDPINQLPKGVARDSALRIRDLKDRLLKDEQFAGLATKELDDVYAAYARRGRVFFDQPAELAAITRGFKPSHSSEIQREEMLRNWPRGTETINDITLDPKLSGTAFRQAVQEKLSPVTRRAFEKQWKKGYKSSGEEARDAIRELFPETSPKGVDINAGIEHLLNTYGGDLPAHMQTPEELRNFVTWLSELDPQHVTSGVPIFGHHPSFDMLNREVFSAQAIGAARAYYEMAARSAKHADDIGMEPRVSLFNLLQESKMTGSGAYDQMLNRLPESLRGRFLKGPEAMPDGAVLHGPFSKETALKNIYVPQKVADDLKGLARTLHDPTTINTVETALGEFWDSWINLFKGHVTAYWPAFITRNVISGQLQNQIGGAYSLNPFARDGMFSSLNDTKEVLRGRNIPNVLEIPLVREAGITDPREGTRLVLSHLAAGRLGGMRQMEAAPQAIEAVAQGTESLLGGMVWGPKSQLLNKPFRWGDLFALWKSRGVGTGFMGTGPKREAAEHLLGRFGEDAGLLSETLNRFAPALAMLRRGIDPSEAIKRVHLLQVDYAAAGVADKYIRRAVPFFSFLKGVTKFMAEELSQRPGGRLGQIIRAESLMQREGLPGALPEHVRKTAAIPLGTTPEGNVNILTSLGLMHEDPLQFFGGTVDRGLGKALTSIPITALQEAGSRLAPQISTPIELATGHSLWQSGPRGGRALVDQFSQLENLVSRAAGRPVELPVGTESIPQLLGASRWVSSAGKLLDERKTARQKAVNLLTGAKITTVSPEQQDRIIGESIDQSMADLGARQFSRFHFPAADLEKLSPADQQARLNLQNLQRALSRRIKERRAAQQAP